MDPRVCKACSDILQAPSIRDDAGEPTYKRIYRVSQRALEASDCPVCKRFLQYVHDIQPQRGKFLGPTADLDSVSITLDSKAGTGNFLSLESPGVKQERNHYFDIYADEGTKAASLTRRRPRIFGLSSPHCFRVIRSWIKTCDEEHNCLPKASFWPTRLLNLSASLGEDIKLEHMQAPVKYAALSYCWGTSATDKQVKTLKENIDAHCDRISFSILPQTIKDAIIVTRGLEIVYLWIDALCIIQDDKEDVLEEMIMMAHIYSTAWLTISASSAPGCGDGFLNQRPDLRENPFVNVLYSFRDQEPCEAKLSNLYGDIAKMPLIWPCEEYVHRRGWTFQETMMSPRVIFFSAVQPYFMCRRGWQGAGDPEPKFYFVQFDLHLIMDYVREGKAPWQEIVGSYTGRKLGVPIDKVRAIHCMRLWFDKAFGGVYWAGLWKSTLEVDLLWIPGRKHTRDANELETFTQFHNNMITTYPTWTWLRFDGQSRYSTGLFHDGVTSGGVKSEILEIVEEPNVDEFGHVLDGTFLGLRCRSKTILVPKWRRTKPRQARPKTSNIANMEKDLASLDIDDAAFIPYQVDCYDESIWDATERQYTIKPARNDRKHRIGRLTFDHYTLAEPDMFASEEDWEGEPMFFECLILATEEAGPFGKPTSSGIVVSGDESLEEDVRCRFGVFIGERGCTPHFEDAVERSYRLM